MRFTKKPLSLYPSVFIDDETYQHYWRWCHGHFIEHLPPIRRSEDAIRVIRRWRTIVQLGIFSIERPLRSECRDRSIRDPPYLHNTTICLYVQRPAKKCANLTKQDPGRVRQKSQARAGRHFSQPRTIFLADLCTTKVFVTFKILTFPLLEDRPNAPLAYHFHLAGRRVRSS